MDGASPAPEYCSYRGRPEGGAPYVGFVGYGTLRSCEDSSADSGKNQTRSLCVLGTVPGWSQYQSRADWGSEYGHEHEVRCYSFTFVVVPQPVLTTSTYVVAWPQGDQVPGGSPWHKAIPPTTQRLSLPFGTPEDAWPLSHSIWAQRWRRDHGFGKGGLFSHGESAPAVTSPRPLRAAMVDTFVVPAVFRVALLLIFSLGLACTEMRWPSFLCGLFYFCLSTSIPILTTGTYVVAWPQGDQLLGWA